MLVITEKITQKLEKKNLSINKLSILMNCSNSSNLNKMILGKKSFSNNIINKLLSILEISKEEFESWIVVDKYSKEVLKLAFDVKKEFPFKRKSILTAKIDSILQEKGMSRTAVAKQINYSQSGLNRMIIGQISMSKPVIEKLSDVLGIPESEIKSWIVADKYSLKALELAVDINK